MSGYKKSSPFRCCAAVLLLSTMAFLLSACADDEWTKAITGEPDSSVLNAPRVVGSPPSLKGDNWPNLADVPEDTNGFTSQEKWDKLSVKMKKDRKKALAAKRRIEKEAATMEQPIENSENTGE